jgi:hypothetical protein
MIEVGNMGETKKNFIVITMLILWIVFKILESDPITIAIGMLFLVVVEVFFFELIRHVKLIADKKRHLLMKLENPMRHGNLNIIIGIVMISASLFAILRFETRLLYIVVTLVLALFTFLIGKSRVLILTHDYVIIHGTKYNWEEICDVMTEEYSGEKMVLNLVISVLEHKGSRDKTCSKKIRLTVDEWENYFAMEILSSYYKSRV